MIVTAKMLKEQTIPAELVRSKPDEIVLDFLFHAESYAFENRQEIEDAMYYLIDLGIYNPAINPKFDRRLQKKAF